mmetsp:Transcript_15629/g.54554  ORF Transcript_15629/g.54554 Transcript_15629/m.54554 type:complete len:241 (-) Transcript_15629:36-758(-)
MGLPFARARPPAGAALASASAAASSAPAPTPTARSGDVPYVAVKNGAASAAVSAATDPAVPRTGAPSCVSRKAQECSSSMIVSSNVASLMSSTVAAAAAANLSAETGALRHLASTAAAAAADSLSTVAVYDVPSRVTTELRRPPMASMAGVNSSSLALEMRAHMPLVCALSIREPTSLYTPMETTGPAQGCEAMTTPLGSVDSSTDALVRGLPRKLKARCCPAASRRPAVSVARAWRSMM